MKLNSKYFDHTLLKADAVSDDIRKLCAEALQYNFYAVCVNSCYVELAVSELSGSNVKVASVVGFPLGAMCADAKAAEADLACAAGADEIDMVINVGALKEGRFDYVKDEIATIVSIACEHGAAVKVILETCCLTDAEIVKGCELAMEAGAAFVKTSTGFGSGGAKTEHIKLMRQMVGDAMKIKASGGIRDYETAVSMIAAGADRLGASASVAIMKAAKTK